MKSMCKLACTLLVSIQSFLATGQEIRNVLLPNISIEHTKKKTISIESAITLKSELKLDAVYNITNNIAVFGSYNFINWQNERYSFLIPFLPILDHQNVYNNNAGFNIGVAYVTTPKNKGNFEFLTGYEYQSLNLTEHSTVLLSEKTKILQNYYKLFAQFNYVKRYTRITHGSMVKLSYFKITKLHNYFYASQEAYNDIPETRFPFVDLSYFLNYQVLKRYNLYTTFQTGLSLSGHIESRVGAIFKLGLKYKFDF